MTLLEIVIPKIVVSIIIIIGIVYVLTALLRVRKMSPIETDARKLLDEIEKCGDPLELHLLGERVEELCDYYKPTVPIRAIHIVRVHLYNQMRNRWMILKQQGKV